MEGRPVRHPVAGGIGRGHLRSSDVGDAALLGRSYLDSNRLVGLLPGPGTEKILA
jgi:hypothetical protein